VIGQTEALLYQLVEERMALKLKPKQQGIPIGGSFEAIADKMGNMKIKPKRKALGQTLNQVYAKANKKRFKGVAK
jgi:hypothetical protein